MTVQGKYFIEEYKKGNVMDESMQVLYEKGHISKDEYAEVVGKEPQQKQIDICSTNKKEKTLKELTEENEQLWQTVEFLLKKIGIIESK